MVIKRLQTKVTAGKGTIYNSKEFLVIGIFKYTDIESVQISSSHFVLKNDYNQALIDCVLNLEGSNIDLFKFADKNNLCTISVDFNFTDADGNYNVLVAEYDEIDIID